MEDLSLPDDRMPYHALAGALVNENFFETGCAFVLPACRPLRVDRGALPRSFAFG